MSTPPILGEPSDPSGTDEGVTDEERRARVTAYVRERIRKEVDAGPRGTAAAIADATKKTTAHIANVKNGKSGVGDNFSRAIAKHWGMTLAELEAEAMKMPLPKRDVFPNKSIVMESPEYENASEDVKKAFDSLVDPESGTDLTVVQWAVALNGLIGLERVQMLPTGGGTPIKSTRK